MHLQSYLATALTLATSISALPAQSPLLSTDTDESSLSAITPNDFTLPSWHISTLLARRLLALSPTGHLTSTFPSTIPSTPHSPPSSVANLPIGLFEYIADCEGNGDVAILALNVATTFRNWRADLERGGGGNVSLSLGWADSWGRYSQDGLVNVDSDDDGDGGEEGEENAEGGKWFSEAALPRLSLMGYIQPLSPAEIKSSNIESCFLATHPDAKYWKPGDSGAAHSGFWARLKVEQVYWIGGFGDRARIGWMDVQEWRDIQREGSGGEEDGEWGLGWGDVRLPGEK